MEGKDDSASRACSDGESGVDEKEITDGAIQPAAALKRARKRMIYEHSDLTVGPYRFMAYVFAPAESEKKGSIGAGVFGVRFKAGNGYRALLMQCNEGRSVQLVACSVEDVKDRLSAVEDFFRSANDRSEINGDSLRTDLDRFARENGLLVAAATLSISDSTQEDASFAMVRVFMAGMPPLVMIENGHYHFPVRSGIPLGINDLHIPMQPLELPVHASVYIHTPLDGRKEELKEMHSMLSHFKSEMLPEGVLLFGLHLKKAES